MRSALVLMFAFACGGSKPAPKPTEPVAGSLLDCPKVAEHVAKTAMAATPRPGVTYEAIDELVAGHCKTDAWSDEAKQCLFAITTIAEGRACADKMSPEQQTAIRTAARAMRKDATGPVEPDDHDSDWVRHVVEEPKK